MKTMKKGLLVLGILAFCLLSAAFVGRGGGLRGWYAVDDLSVGGISVTDLSGDETQSANRMKTGYWPLGAVYVRWKEDSGVAYLAVFYNENYDLLKATEFSTDSGKFSGRDAEGAKYVRFLFKKVKGGNFSEGAALPVGCVIVADKKLGTTHDLPENAGVANVLARAELCASVTYETRAVLPNQKEDFPAGKTVSGIVYSSTRQETLYVPNTVSLESYLTAMNDPQSYLYTRTVALRKSKTYYGTVCSAYVSYCFDLPCVYTTNQLGRLDSIRALKNQSMDGLKLGDILLLEGTHVCIVIDILRDERGRVLQITEAEATPPGIRTRTYSRKGFQERWFDQGYRIFRYENIDSVTYEAPAWLDPVKGIRTELLLNPNLCPRRGDKANWPLGETVEIDVLDAADYTDAEVYREDELISVLPISKDRCLRLKDLSSGKYFVRLSNGAKKSEPVSFIVVEAQISVEDLGHGTVRIWFDSWNATPSWFAWCYPDGKTAVAEAVKNGEALTYNQAERRHMAAANAVELTEEDRKRGCTVSSYASGVWMFKVEFETEYGVISSDFVQLKVS